MITNIKRIKISSKIETPKEYSIDDDIQLIADGQIINLSCVKIDTKSNQDGTVDQDYIFKAL